MRISIEIDENLIRKVMRAGGFKTKRAAVTAALREYLEQRKSRRILRLKGKVRWVGDLDDWRRN